MDFNKAYSRTNFAAFLQEFLPDDFEPTIEPSEIAINGNASVSAFELGYSPSLDLGVFEIKHEHSNDAKVTLSKIAFDLIRNHSFNHRISDKALAVFVPKKGNNWRFSLCSYDTKIDETTNKVKRSWSNPRRFSFVLGENAKIKTPKMMLMPEDDWKIKERYRDRKHFTALEDLEYRFSKEVLSKNFYKELYDWYLWAVQIAKYPNGGVKNNNSNEKCVEKYIDYSNGKEEVKEHIIRLITRLMFVWFIKQEPIKLVPKDIFDEDELMEILSDFDKNGSNSSYYHGILQNLFFATLNRPITTEDKIERGWASDLKEKQKESYGVKNLFRDNNSNSLFKDKQKIENLFNRVPYLNGGLFECLDNFDKQDEKVVIYRDGFSRVPERRPTLPDYLFFGEPRKIDLKEYEYNKQNKKWMDKEKEVQGIIKILETYNWTIDENNEEDVDIALDPELLGKVFENLLGTYNPETSENARKNNGSFYTPKEIVDYMVEQSLSEYKGNLKDIKILDPACGSGAFPMGCLNKIIEKLNPPKEKRYEEKLRIIENCIYGVDIQPIAVQITKLRFFISLICEQKPTDVARDNFGIKVLPNLETKFVCADSLTSLTCIRPNDTFLREKREALYDLRKKIVKADTFKKKMDLREKDKNLCKEILDHLGDRDNLTELWEKERKKLEMDIDKLPEIFQEAKMVHGELFDNYEQKNLLQIDINKKKRDELITNMKNLEKQIAIIKTGKNSENEMKMMISWNPYDQNSKNKFFDAEWMFGLTTENGYLNTTIQTDFFDIVIGNPPYVQVEKGLYDKERFPYSEGKDKGKQNLYKVFVENSYNFTKKNGFATMIVQSSLMADLSSQFTRELLLTRTEIKEILEFPKKAKNKDGQVFDSVLQGTCIYFLRHKVPNENHELKISIDNDKTTLGNLQYETLKQSEIIRFYPNGYFIPLVHTKEFNVIKKIQENSIMLKEIITDISQGDLNLTNESKYFSNNLSDIQLLRGKNIHRYFIYYISDEFIQNNYKKQKVELNYNKKFFISQNITGTTDDFRLHFAITELNKKFLFGHTVNKFSIKSKINEEFLLGILNSKLLDWYFRKTSTNNHVNGYEIEQLPIFKTSLKQQQPIITLVNQILSVKKENPQSDTSDLERKIDRLVYALYGLTEDEIKIIEQ